MPCCLSNRLSPNVFSSAVNGREINSLRGRSGCARQKGESLLRGHRRTQFSQANEVVKKGLIYNPKSAPSRCALQEDPGIDELHQPVAAPPISGIDRTIGSCARSRPANE